MNSFIYLSIILMLTLFGCGPNSPMEYKLKPSGKMYFNSSIENNLIYNTDTLSAPFSIHIDFDIDRYYTLNINLIPQAYAKSVDPTYFNYVNPYKLNVSIDKPFIFRGNNIESNINFITLPNSNIFGYDWGRTLPYYIHIDEKCLYYAKFRKGWAKFTVSGELEDGQRFKFEKEVYLDL